MNNKQIINFLLNPNNNKEGYFLLLEKFKYICISFNFPNDSCEDLFHDFLYKNIWNNTKLLEFITKSNTESIISYINRSIKNFLINNWNRNKANNETLSLNNSISESDEEYIETIKAEHISNEIIYEAYAILEEIVHNLDERKKKILCQYIYGDKKDFNLDMGKDALYKAIERLKKDLKDLIIKHKFSEESFNFFISNIYVSKICEKFC